MQNELLDDYQQTSIRFYYDLKTLRNITLICVAGAMGLYLTRVIFALILQGMVDSVNSGVNFGTFMWYANSIDRLEVFSSALLTLSLIPFFMWLFRAYYNLEHVKLKGLSVTAGWAVGWFFIPFANVFYYDVVILNELMRGTKHLSTGHGVSQDSAPTPIAPFGLFWLLSYIIGSILSSVGDEFIKQQTPESFKTGLTFFALSDALILVSGIFIFYIVFWVSKKQAEIAANEIAA